MRQTLAVLAALAAPLSLAQPPAPLPQKEAMALYQRAVQLMDSVSLTVPGLPTAAAPVMEGVRQALRNLETVPINSAFSYAFLTHARGYMALVDAVPRPQPLPLEARRQFTETRDILDRLESHFRALLDQKEAQLRSPDRDNLRRYAEANQKISPPLPGRPRAVFLGDSITDGWPVNEYFPDRDFLNRGIGGQVTSEMLGRMKADVIDLKARVLLVLAGTNDIARGAPVKTIQNNLSMIADLADRNNVRPLFASVLPVSDYHQRVNPSFLRTTARPPSTILELNRWIQSFCAQRGYLYVDYFKAMVDASGHLRAELADDGLHPNSAGYRVMAPIALAAIEKELASGVSKRAAAKGSGLDPAAPEKKTKPGAQALRQH